MKELKSSMAPVGVNLTYVLNYPTIKGNKELSLLPSSKAMHWCMMACGVHRIFNEKDLREFLFRLPIALHCRNLLQNWFGYNELMTYKVGENQFIFSVSDVFAHYGIEIQDSLNNYESREVFLNSLEKNQRTAQLISLFSGIEVIPLPHDDDGDPFYSSKEEILTAPATEKILYDAEFFCNDVMKLVPDDLFIRQDRFEMKISEIENRKVAIAGIPKFEISDVPSKIIDDCMLLMFKDEWITDIKQNAPEDYIELASKYIFLAWLFANDLMISDGVFADPVEGINLNPEDYEEEDGINLLHTYELYNMEEVKPIMKGLFFK